MDITRYDERINVKRAMNEATFNCKKQAKKAAKSGLKVISECTGNCVTGVCLTGKMAEQVIRYQTIAVAFGFQAISAVADYAEKHI